MGDDQTGPTLKEMLQSQLNLLLGGGIHAGRGFVEDQYRGILKQGTGDRKTLALPSA